MEAIKKEINKRIDLLHKQRNKLRKVLRGINLLTKEGGARTRSKLLCIGYELAFLNRLLEKMLKETL